MRNPSSILDDCIAFNTTLYALVVPGLKMNDCPVPSLSAIFKLKLMRWDPTQLHFGGMRHCWRGRGMRTTFTQALAVAVWSSSTTTPPRDR